MIKRLLNFPKYTNYIKVFSYLYIFNTTNSNLFNAYLT